MSATHWLNGYAVVGTLTKPWALRGEIKVIAESQHLERYCSLGFFHLGNPKTEIITPIPNAQLRPHQKEFLIQLEGVDSPESAAEFRGQLLLIEESQRVELPEGEFYHYDTPCTIDNQIKMLKLASFEEASMVWREENTTIIVADKI